MKIILFFSFFACILWMYGLQYNGKGKVFQDFITKNNQYF